MDSSYNELAEMKHALHNYVAELIALKEAKEGLAAMRSLITDSAVTLIELRQLNRTILRNEEEVKLHTEAAKAPVDSTTLRLNNLLYEKNHFVKAIKSCNEYKSKYPNIELVSEDAFFRDALPELKADPDLATDRHKLMLQRLQFELYQRKELAKQREELEARRRTLHENVESRKRFLATLPEHLKSLKSACLPLEQQLGVLHTEKLERQRLADLLPAPLYILYSQLLFHNQVFGGGIEVKVNGSQKEAEAALHLEPAREAGLSDSVAAGNAKQDRTEEDESWVQWKRSKHTHEEEAPLADLDGTAVHPLTVTLTLFDAKAATTGQKDGALATEQRVQLACLRFEYIRKLRLVCCSLEGAGASRPSLDTLFPDDSGTELPDSALQLLQPEAVAKSLGGRPGKPYKWAQRLAGLDFLPDLPPALQSQAGGGRGAQADAGVAAGLVGYRQEHRVQTVLQRIRAHFGGVQP